MIFEDEPLFQEYYQSRNIGFDYLSVLKLSVIISETFQITACETINLNKLNDQLIEFARRMNDNLLYEEEIKHLEQQLYLIAPETLRFVVETLLRLQVLSYQIIDPSARYFNNYTLQYFLHLFRQYYHLILQINSWFFGKVILQLEDDQTFIIVVGMFAQFLNSSERLIIERVYQNVHIQIFQNLKKQLSQQTNYQYESQPINQQFLFNQPSSKILDDLFGAICAYHSYQENSSNRTICQNQDLFIYLNTLQPILQCQPQFLFNKAHVREQARAFYYISYVPNQTVFLNENCVNDTLKNDFRSCQDDIQREQKNLNQCDCIYTYSNLLTQNEKYQLLKCNPFRFDTTEFCVTRDNLASDILSHFFQYCQDRINQFTIKDVQLVYLQQIYVSFKAEDGVDAGGLSKEVFPVFIKQLVTEQYWLFRKINQYYYPDCMSDHVPQQIEQSFTLIGVVFGICLLNNFQIDDYFPSVFYHLLLNDQQLTFEQLQEFSKEIDVELVDSLMKLYAMKGNSELQELLELNFTYEIDVFDFRKQVDLKPDGSNILVTGDNIQEYVYLRLKALIIPELVEKMFQCMRQGLRYVIPQFKLQFLNISEFRYILCGDQQINFDQLKQITTYQQYTANSHAIVIFWQILNQFNRQKQQQFIKFMFSVPRMPPFGFKKFEIQRNSEVGSYPVAHTCASILDLPDYPTAAEMRKKLEFSIQFCEGFGVV